MEVGENMLPWPRADSIIPAGYDQGPISKRRGKFFLITLIFYSTRTMSTKLSDFIE
jgi:hypothetical protein